jgi:acyl-homoserine lactone acylase PvdQ
VYNTRRSRQIPWFRHAHRLAQWRWSHGSQLPLTETRAQRKTRLYYQKQTKAEIGQHLSRNTIPAKIPELITSEGANTTDPNVQLSFEELWLWEDTGEVMNQEDADSLAWMQALHEELIQQQIFKNWTNFLDKLFPAYLHLKKQTHNWTASNCFHNFSNDVCECLPGNRKVREVDLIDLMGKCLTQRDNHVYFFPSTDPPFVFASTGQKQVQFDFCTCTPDPVQLLANGYVASTPVFPQTAFSVRLLNFYDLLWNICNSHATSSTKVLQR